MRPVLWSAAVVIVKGNPGGEEFAAEKLFHGGGGQIRLVCKYAARIHGKEFKMKSYHSRETIEKKRDGLLWGRKSERWLIYYYLPVVLPAH